MTEESVTGLKSPHSPNESETSEKTPPALARFLSLKGRPKGDGTPHRSLWGDIKRRASHAFVHNSNDASSGSTHDGSSNPSSSTTSSSSSLKKGGGHLSSRIASRLRLAKGAKASAEYETVEPLEEGETARHNIQMADGHGLAEGGALDSLATPRVGHGRRWFPSGRLMRSSSCVTSGVLEPRVMMPLPDEEEHFEQVPSKAKAPSFAIPSAGIEGPQTPPAVAELMKAEVPVEPVKVNAPEPVKMDTLVEPVNVTGPVEVVKVETPVEVEKVNFPVEPVKVDTQVEPMKVSLPVEALEVDPQAEPAKAEAATVESEDAQPGPVETEVIVATPVNLETIKAVLKDAATKLKAEVSSLEQIDPATRRTGYDTQYEQLRNKARTGEALPSAVAAKMCNRAKNRYHDILPFDSTRVVLKGADRESTEGGDYINASHIDGPPGPTNLDIVLPHYVAAQGPLDNTVADFWEMVVQEKCVAVLMLSREIEGTKAKCGHYFPEDEGVTEDFGHVRVTTLSSEEMDVSDGTTLRILRIENTRDGGAVTEISHFHHEDWLDHGAPRKTGPVRKLIRHIRTGPLSAGPFLVHCSAGIGRTGTYCCIDFTIRRLLAGDLSALDIPGTIEHMRRQRTGMVQSRDQFRFCYNAILQEVEELAAKPHLLKAEGIEGT